MTTCKIRWINERGDPTDDTSVAIGRVMLPKRTQYIHGRPVTSEATDWFPICAEHAEQLQKPGMHDWIFERWAP